MKAVLAAALAVLLTSCGQTASVPSATSTPRSELKSSSPNPSVVLSKQPIAKIPCKLPIGIGRSISGFITYPGGTFTPDPASDPAKIDYKGPNSSSIGGLGVPSYDSTAGRWLPVSMALVSPDGATYAYSELVFPAVGPTPINGPGPGPIGSRVHLVSVGTAADHVLFDSQSLWEAVAYSGRQVYLIHPCLEGCGADAGGLWTLDASTRTIQELAAPDAPVPFNPSVGLSQHIWTVIGRDAAWATDPQGGLARFDFASKTVSVWFTVPGKMLRPIGLDAQGFPIAEGEANYSVAGSTRGGAWLVTAPQRAAQIEPDSAMIDGAIGDSHGIWLLSFNEIHLWLAGNQLTQIAVLTGQGDRGLGGPCQ